jgi:hypothetical protein
VIKHGQKDIKATFIIIETGLGEDELSTPPISQEFNVIQVNSVKYRTTGIHLAMTNIPSVVPFRFRLQYSRKIAFKYLQKIKNFIRLLFFFKNVTYIPGVMKHNSRLCRVKSVSRIRKSMTSKSGITICA